MATKQQLEKMSARQYYRNLWHTDLMHAISADCPYCCFATFCAPCASYMLRRRALYNDMSRVCACMQTQHKIEMDKRDGKFGSQPAMAVPPTQQMSRVDQPIPPLVGHPSEPSYGQPYGDPPPGQVQDYPAAGYPPPQAYPPHAYPPQAYPPQAYPPQAYPPQAHPPQAYPPQAHPPQAYPPQAYPPQAYPPQAYPPPAQPHADR